MTQPNFLSQNRFKAKLDTLPNIELTVQSFSIPQLQTNLPKLSTNTYLNGHEQGDRISYSDLTVTFALDENLESYSELKKWISDSVSGKIQQRYFDMTVFSLTNNSNPNKKFKFYYCTPYLMSGFELNSTNTNIEPIIITMQMKIVDYDIE